MAKSREQYIAENSEYNYTEDLVTFSLLDESTVKKLQKDGDIKLPRKKIDVPKDMRWNTKQMSSKLLQGILNGDSIPKIAKSLEDVIGNNQASTTRNARTMVTGAENAGRFDSYDNLAEQGVVQKKVWIATPDSRTRESHIEIDGEEVDIDADFSNGCKFPGDPDGDPSEVWNCRCSMRDHIIGFRKADGTIAKVGAKRNDTMHDEQMAAEKASRGIEEQAAGEEEQSTERIESKKIKATMDAEDYERFMDLVNDSDNSELYRTYADKINTVNRTKNGGGYSHGPDALEYCYAAEEGMSRYSILAHEYNHAFDYKIGKDSSLAFSEIETINNKCKIGSGIIKPVKEVASNSDEFMSALRKDMEVLRAKGLDECYKEFRTTTRLRNATGGVQDALDGFYSTQKLYQGWGHGEKYYNRMYNKWIKGFDNEKELKDAFTELGFDASNQTKIKRLFRQYEAANEAWANVGSAVTCGGDELDAFEKYMPNTLKTYKKIAGGLKNVR